MANIIITTHWLDGDVIPFVSIGKILKKRGHTVTILTHCYFEKVITDSGLGFKAWDSWKEFNELVEDMDENKKSTEPLDTMENHHRKYGNIEKRFSEYEKIVSYCNKKDTVILAKNRSSISSLLVSEKFKIPLISVFMNPHEPSSIVFYEKFEIFYGNKIVDSMNELREKVGLKPIKSWLDWQKSPRSHIGLWPKWFADVTDEWDAPITQIGFPLKSKSEKTQSLPAEVQEILSRGETPILITGGTTKNLKEGFYDMSAKACEHINKPVFLLTRYPELVPKDLPENVKHYEYLPLVDIMPYLSAVIHHGGIGTITDALINEVPQLVLPCFVDRPYNAKKLKKLGLAEYLPVSRWNPILIRQALDKILEPEFKIGYKTFSKKIRNEDGNIEICDLVESAVGNTELIINYTDVCKPQKVDIEIDKKDSRKKIELSPDKIKEILLRKRSVNVYSIKR